MTVAAALAAYAVCAGVLGPRLLGRANWAERAPRLGILTYLAAVWSVVAACGLAGLTLTVHATALAAASPPASLPLMTTGALRALDPGQVDAVLAHERAHLACHHHRLLAIARIGRQVFPFIPLMRDAAGQVARLTEMHADDAATAGRDARPLATALVVLASAGTGPVPETPALAAAGTDAVHRIQRLLAPAEPLSRVRRHLLRAAAAGLALVPLLLALAPAVVALALGRVQARRADAGAGVTQVMRHR